MAKYLHDNPPQKELTATRLGKLRLDIKKPRERGKGSYVLPPPDKLNWSKNMLKVNTKQTFT